MGFFSLLMLGTIKFGAVLAALELVVNFFGRAGRAGGSDATD